MRQAPDPDVIREAFRQHVTRRIRRSDTTLSLEAQRYEVPSAYRHLERVRVAYARWDLGHVHLVDPKTGDSLVRILPLDRRKNASGERRVFDPACPHQPHVEAEKRATLPPLMQQCLEEHAASGLPPGYLPGPDRDNEDALTEPTIDNLANQRSNR